MQQAPPASELRAIQQSVRPSIPTLPHDSDVPPRIEEATRVSRETFARERNAAPATVSDDQDLADAEAWWGSYQQILKSRDHFRNMVRDEFDKKIQALIGSLPPNQQHVAMELQDSRNKFLKDDMAVPLHRELGEAARIYVEKRLGVEDSALRPLQNMLLQPPPGVEVEKVQIVSREIGIMNRIIAKLQALRPQVNTLSGMPTQIAAKSEQPVEPPPMPSDSNIPLLETDADQPTSKDWKLDPDPGPPLPAWPEKFSWNELRVVHLGLVVYPAGPTHALAAGIPRDSPQYGSMIENLLIGNILTGKPVGRTISGLSRQFRATAHHWRPALSSDGERVAYLDAQETVRVVQTRTGKLLRAIPLARPSEFGLFFPRTDRLLALDVVQTKKGIVFDLDSGQAVTTFTLEADVEDQTGYVAISPGGRFLAMASKDQGMLPDLIVLIDLATGQQAGEIYPGGRSGRTSPQINALAFSPDGNELAAFVGYPDQANLLAMAPTLFVWKLDTGREVTRVTIETGGRGEVTTYVSPEPLQWFPDQKAVLVHHELVVNRADGKLLDVIRAEGDVNARYVTKVLDDNRILTATHHHKLIVKQVKRR